jgi:hypothetical protein
MFSVMYVFALMAVFFGITIGMGMGEETAWIFTNMALIGPKVIELMLFFLFCCVVVAVKELACACMRRPMLLMTNGEEALGAQVSSVQFVLLMTNGEEALGVQVSSVQFVLPGDAHFPAVILPTTPKSDSNASTPFGSSILGPREASRAASIPRDVNAFAGTGTVPLPMPKHMGPAGVMYERAWESPLLETSITGPAVDDTSSGAGAHAGAKRVVPEGGFDAA